MDKHLDFEGIPLHLEFRQGFGDVSKMPTGFGIYAEIRWPTLNLRIGESQNVRSRNLAHIRWADKHRLGTHSPKETLRRGRIVDLVKRWGSEGLEHYLITSHPRLSDRVLRVECEKVLHAWARTQTLYIDINTQRGYRTIN